MMDKKKALEAKVKDSYQFDTLTAFSGVEYVKGEWRPVLEKNESAALVHPFLDVKEVGGKELTVTAKDKLAEMIEPSSTAEEVTGEAPEVTDEQSDDADETETARKKKRKAR